MLDVQIRRAIPADALVLSKLICEKAFDTLKPHYSEAQWNTFLTYYSPVLMSEKMGTQIIFCALLGKTIVGCVGLQDNFVVGFYTRLQNRSQGIGTALMNHLEMYAREMELAELRLAPSPEGLAFYYKNGWTKIEDFVVDHYGVRFNETLMKRNL